MARALRELEWPVATLDRGGSPPQFITVLPERFGPYTDQTGGTFRVKYRPHRFHILDAIGYAVATAKSTDELNAVRERYIDAPKMSYGFIVPPDLDPGGKERLRVYIDALNRLVQSASKPAQPAPQPQPSPQPQPAPQPSTPSPKATGSVKGRSSNATCTSKARKLSATGCNFVAVDPGAMGGLAAYNEVRTPQASQYCRGFTGGEPCEYWLYPPGGGPDGPREWARFDGYDGYSLIECKCGYDWIVDAAEGKRGLGFEQRKALDILDSMLREVRKHRDLARDCGVPYRMVVSSAKLKAYLMSYGGIPASLIDFQPSEKCEEGAL